MDIGSDSLKSDKNDNTDSQKSKDVKVSDEKNDKVPEKDELKSRTCNKDDSKHRQRKSRTRSRSVSKRRSRSRDKKDRKRSSTPDYKKRRSRSRDRRRSRDRKKSRSRDRKRRSRSVRKRHRSRSKDRKPSEVGSNDKSYDDKSPRRSYRHSDYDKSDRKRRKSRSRDRDRRPYDSDRRYHGSPSRSFEPNYDRSNYYDEDHKTDYSNSQRNNYNDGSYNRRFNNNQFGNNDNSNKTEHSVKDTKEPLFGIDFSENKCSNQEENDSKNSAIPVLLSSSSSSLSQNMSLNDGPGESQPQNFVRPMLMPASDLRFPPPRLQTSQPNLLNFKEILPNMREPPPNFMAFRMDSNFQLRMNNGTNQAPQVSTQQSQVMRPPLPVLNQGQITLRNFDPNQLLRPMHMLQGAGARIEIPIDLRLLNPELRLSMFNPSNTNRPPIVQPNPLTNIFRGFQLDHTRMMQQPPQQQQQQQSQTSQHLLPPNQQLLPQIRIPSSGGPHIQPQQQQQQQLSDIPPPPPPQNPMLNNNARPILIHQPQHHLPFNIVNNVPNKNVIDSSITTLSRTIPDQRILFNQISRPDFNEKPNDDLSQRGPVNMHQFPPPPPVAHPSLSQPTSTTNVLDSFGSQQKSNQSDAENKAIVKQKSAAGSELYSPNSCISDNSSVDAYTEALFEEPFIDNGTPLEEESDTSVNMSQSNNESNKDIPNLKCSGADDLKGNDDNISGNCIIKFKEDINSNSNTTLVGTLNDKIMVNANLNNNKVICDPEDREGALTSLVQKNIDLTGTLNLFHVNDLKKVLETANSATTKSKNNLDEENPFENNVLNVTKNANSGIVTTKLSKAQKMDQIAEEVKAALKPHFFKKLINKDDYKDIMRRAVPKIFSSKSTLDSTRIQTFIQEYVNKITRNRKSGKTKNTTAHGASHDKKHSGTKLNPKS